MRSHALSVKAIIPAAWLPVALVASLSGCERDPLGMNCSPLPAGTLAVSELRGKQKADDTFGQWIELYNATNKPVTLDGVTLDISKTSGEGRLVVPVRRTGIEVKAQSYVVLGRVRDDARPDHVAYGFIDDFTPDLYTNGIIDVLSCGELVDRLLYFNLPDKGTLAFDGDLALTAAANDEASAWCNDDRVDGSAAQGTPAGKNLSCKK